MKTHIQTHPHKAQSLLRHVTIALLASAGVVMPIGTGGAQTTAKPADSHPDSIAVASVVNQFHDALSKGDSSAVLALLADDVVILESGGLETRNQYRSHHLGGDIQFSRAVKSVRSPITVVVAGETAWTAATSTTQGEFNGRSINSTGAESMVLSRTATGWKIRSIHWSSRNRRPAS